MSPDNDFVIIPQSPGSKKVIETVEQEYKPIISRESWPATIQYFKTREDKPSDLPSSYSIKCAKKLDKVNGCNVYTLSKGNGSGTSVLYIHGGGYVMDVYKSHVCFCDDLVEHTGFDVCVPCYPLAPQHTFEESYALLDKIYEKLLSEKKRIIVIGDSAGAGLALGFVQCLKKNNRALPDRMVLISPFIDATLSHPGIDEYDEKDVMLKKYLLLEYGKFWAGNTPVTDHHISPINGDMNGLPPIMIFAGNSELTYLDSVKLHNKLKECGTESKLIIGDGQIHVFVLIKEIPESERCREMIFDFIS